MLYQTIRITTQSRTFSPRYEKQQQNIWISDREKRQYKATILQYKEQGQTWL